MKKSPWLNTVTILASVMMIFFALQLPVINSLVYDVYGYYLYLPLTFKYHDLTLQHPQVLWDLNQIYQNTDSFYQAVKLENGNWVMKYSMGLSVCYAPFYFIGDIWAKLSGVPTDGFSRPYQMSILYGCVLYTLIGIYYLRKILNHFFSDAVAALTMFLIVFGTNYLFHVSMHGQGLMSHNVLFSLYAIILWHTIKWYQTYRLIDVIKIGLAIGLAALIRPTELISVLIPLLYGINSPPEIKKQILLFWQKKGHVLVFGLCVAVVLGVQFIYLKKVSGKWYYNTYGAINPGEGFEFKHPFILEVLFSFRKGWFIYTPIMIFSLLGFYHLYRQYRFVFWMCLGYFILNLYIVSSWSCWWYAQSYSSRSLIPSYVVLSISLGAFIQWIWNHQVKWILISMMSALLALNLFQTWQMFRGILEGSQMSRDYYQSVFLQTSLPTDEQRKLLLINHDLPEEEFDVQKTDHLIVQTKKIYYKNTSSVDSQKTYSFHLNASKEYSPKLSSAYKDITDKSFVWIKACCYIKGDPVQLENSKVDLCTMMSHSGYSFKFKTKSVSIHKKSDSLCFVEINYITPELRSRKDSVHVFMWNKAKQNLDVDSLYYEVWEPVKDRSVF